MATSFFLLPLHLPPKAEPDVVMLSSLLEVSLVPGWMGTAPWAFRGCLDFWGNLGGRPTGAMHLNCFAQQHIGSSLSQKSLLGTSARL